MTVNLERGYKHKDYFGSKQYQYFSKKGINTYDQTISLFYKIRIVIILLDFSWYIVDCFKYINSKSIFPINFQKTSTTVQ